MAASLRITKSGGAPTTYKDTLAKMTDALKQAKQAVEMAEEWHREAQDQILSLMAAHGTATGTVELDDAKYKVTSVTGERLSIDEPGLRKALSAPVFDKLCQLKLDRTKLELALAEGRIDPLVVAQHTSHLQNRPHVRLTLVQGSEK